MSHTLYVGSREGPERHVWRYQSRKWHPLPARGCKDNALPSHFDWHNDDPASFSLSLALCGDLLLDGSLAVRLHLDFWRLIVQVLPVQVWALRAECLQSVLLDLYSLDTGKMTVPMWRHRAYSSHPAGDSPLPAQLSTERAKGGA